MWKCHNCNQDIGHEDMFCGKCEQEQFIHCELCGKVINKHKYSEKIGGMVCLNGCKKEDIFQNRPYLKNTN